MPRQNTFGVVDHSILIPIQTTFPYFQQLVAINSLLHEISAAPSMVEYRTSVLGIGARASPAGILIPERKHLQKPAVGVHLF